MKREAGTGSERYAVNVRRFYLYRFVSNFQFWMPIFVIFLIEERGLTLAQIALLETVFSLTSLSAEVPTGGVADRFGRRTSILLGSATLAGAIVFFALAPSFGWLAGAYFVWAIARTLESGADSAFVYDSLSAVGHESQFAQIIGRAQAFWLAGALSASLIGAPLAALIGLQPVILMGGGSSLLAAGVAFTFVEPPRTGGDERLRYVETIKEAGRFILRTPQVSLTASLFAVFLGLGFTIYTFFQPLLRENEVPLAAFALFTTPPQLVAVLGSLLAYRVAAQLKERNFFLVAGAGISLTIIFIGVLPGLLVFALFPVFRLFTSMFNPIALYYINTRTPQQIRATVVSVTSMAESLFLAFLGPPIGYLADSTSLETAFVVVGLSVALLGGLNLVAWLAADRRGTIPHEVERGTVLAGAGGSEE
jgi:MFS family permease